MLKSHIIMDYTAVLMCGRCGASLDAVGGSESEAETTVVKSAESEGWTELDGNIYCKECSQ